MPCPITVGKPITAWLGQTCRREDEDQAVGRHRRRPSRRVGFACYRAPYRRHARHGDGCLLSRIVPGLAAWLRFMVGFAGSFRFAFIEIVARSLVVQARLRASAVMLVAVAASDSVPGVDVTQLHILTVWTCPPAPTVKLCAV